MNGTQHHYRSGDGLNLFYRSFGDSGPTVLCLHGLTRNSKDFRELAARLSDRYRVICPDIRGRGLSDRGPHVRNYGWHRYVQDVWTLLEHVAVDRFSIIGTSLGGLLSMVMNWQQPHRIQGMVLNDIGPEVPATAAKRIVAYTGQVPAVDDWHEAARLARELYGHALPGMTDEFWVNYARRSFRENEEGRPEPDIDPNIGEALRHPPFFLTLMIRLGRWGLVRELAGVPLDMWAAFEAIQAPVLLFRGERSDVLTAELVARMKAVNASLEVVEVPRRGHAPLLDEPGVPEAIEQFLARVTAGPA
ncbi:MAG: alpha/beta hydrolase [Xanthomonadales bacterium]|nr:alpha/beta hydrolase [Xanthomonadales bacterium]